MNTFLFIHTRESEGDHALIYTRNLAEKLKSKIIVMFTAPPIVSATTMQLSTVAGTNPDDYQIKESNPTESQPQNDDIVTYLSYQETARFSMQELVSKYKIDVIVKGCKTICNKIDLDLQNILSKTLCPLYLIPEGAALSLNHIGYLTDLRYCKREIVSFARQLQRGLKNNLTICNVAASGLPDMAEPFANSMFKELMGAETMKLMNIKERNITKTVDVLAHIMHIDLFILSYRRSHYNNLIVATESEYQQIHTPLLLFPS